MKRILLSIILISGFISMGAMAQSAKFAAVWTDGGTVVESSACASTYDGVCEAMVAFDSDIGVTFANIKVPQAKELLVGISAQVGLFTQTTVKGKKGSSSTATALAAGGVLPLACSEDNGCFVGKPGFIVLDARQQELSATLGGIIESCTVDVQVDPDTGTGSGIFDLDDCVVEQEEISLAISTLSANHFNFVFPDLPQGDYAVIGIFATAAAAAAVENECPPESDFCDPGDGDASAISHAFIGKTMLTVQQVRAVKGSLGGMDFIDIE
jgi:hypothetical protein